MTSNQASAPPSYSVWSTPNETSQPTMNNYTHSAHAARAFDEKAKFMPEYLKSLHGIIRILIIVTL